MKQAQAEPATTLASDSLVPLESVLCTEELNQRPLRPPDYEAENRALIAFYQALTDSPHDTLQKIAEIILEVFHAGSSGLSLLNKDDGGKSFDWPAIAGAWKTPIGSGTPREFSPCGDVLDRNAPLLFRHMERRYTYFQAVMPPVEECLLVPFYVEGKAVGTIWVIAHDAHRKFDTEDLRQLVSLGKFASSVYQMLAFHKKAVAMNEALTLGSVRQHELTEGAEELSARLQVEIVAKEKIATELAEKARLLDLSHDAIIVRDLAGRIRYWNHGAEVLYGWSSEEVMGKISHTLFQTEFSTPFESMMEELHRNGHWTGELVHTKRNGQRITVLARKTLDRDSDGNPVALLQTLTDITARKKVEVALCVSEERARAFVMASSDMVYRMSSDWSEMNQLDGRNHLANTDKPDRNWLQKYIHLEDHLSVLAVIKKAIQTKSIFEMEHRVRHMDGTLGWTFSRAVPLLDAQGKILEWFGSATDVTERKRAEETLRASEERYRTLFNSIDEGFCVIEMIFDRHNNPVDWCYLEVNPNFEKHSGLHEVTGKRARELIANIEPYWFQVFGKIVLTGEPARFVNEVKGLNRWIDLYAFRVGGQGSCKIAVVFNDITERRRAETNLSLLAAVSQDLAHLTGVDEMMETVGAKIGAHLRLSLCAFGAINEMADEAVVTHDWHRADVPGLVGVYRLADFVEAEFIRVARAGEVIVVRDVALDPRTSPEKFTALKIASFLCVPLIRDGQWRFTLSLYHSTAHDWREDEIELARELTTRIWMRLERLRGEAELRESQRFLRSSLDALSGQIAVLDESGKILEVNEAWRLFADKNQFKGSRYGIGASYLRNSNRTLSPVSAAPDYSSGIEDVIAGRRDFFELEYPCHSLTEKHWFVMRVTRFKSPGPVRIVIVHDSCTERKLAEESSHASEERYRTLFSSIDEGFCVIEMIFDEKQKPVDWRYLEVNPSFEKQTGIPNITGKRIRDLFPDHEEYWFEIYGKVALTGAPVRFVNEAKAMDSNWFDLYAFRVGGTDSRKVAILFTNITERLKTENQVRVSEVRYRRLFEAAHDGVLLLDPNTRKITDANPFMTKLLGYSQAQLVGKEMFEIGRLQDQAASRETFQKLKRNREVRYENLPLESQTGRPREVEVVANLYQENGHAVIQCNIRDITERKQAAIALSASEERFRAAVGIVSSLIWTNNAQGFMAGEQPGWANFTGQTFEEYQGYGWAKAVDPEDAVATIAAWKLAVAEKRLFAFEHRLRRRDGEWRLCSIHAVPLLDEVGEIREWVGIHTDITERKQAETARRRLDVLTASNQKLELEIIQRQAVEESLKKSEQHQRQLLAQAQQLQVELRQLSQEILRVQEEERKRISRELHDVIAQTLTGINLRLATLKKEAGEDTNHFGRSIARTQRQVEESMKIVHEFARELRPTMLDDLGLIPALHTFLKIFTKRTGIRTGLTTFAEVEQLDMTWRTMLFRVAQEALINVERHAQASRVEVIIRKRPDCICMTIKDDGKSFHVEGVLSVTSGKRLGLLGMRERLEMVGGHFDIESAPGKGTSVIAQIPLSKSAHEQVSMKSLEKKL